MTPLDFTCPYCSKPTTITNPNYYENWEIVNIAKSNEGNVGIFVKAITCPNTDCNKLWLRAELCKAHQINYRPEWQKGSTIHSWQLLPESEAKALPDYIPSPIKEDYYEACRIRNLSPKASATLARRCLQGMIRDFWKIRKLKLKEEIDELEHKVDPDTWDSIDAVRSVGNIGAHMEKDINVIIAVDPEEARLLIGLIEQLIDDWYITREDRKKRTVQLKKLAKSKEEKKRKSRGNA